MNDKIIEAEKVNGSKAEGYAAGEKYFQEIKRKEQEKLGGDSQFK